MFELILFRVTQKNTHVITWANDREDAKREAHPLLGGDPDRYIVDPLTEMGDSIYLAISLHVSTT